MKYTLTGAIMKMQTIMFPVVLLLIVPFSFLSCDRVNMYDMASGKSRSAYALSIVNPNCYLYIVNLHFNNTFVSTFTHPAPSGISVNDQNNVIIYNTGNIYSAHSNFTQWNVHSIVTENLNILGRNDNFIYYNTSDTVMYRFNESNPTWSAMYSIDGEGIFQGSDGGIYFVDFDTDMFEFYAVHESNVPLIASSASIAISPMGTFLGGYKTKSAFYVWYAGLHNSLFKVQSGAVTNYITTTIAPNGIVDAVITDDDKIFVVANDGVDYELFHVLSPGSYMPLFKFNFVAVPSNFNIDALDNNNLIVAVSGSLPGTNGLYIYNVKDNTITQFITAIDVIALHVPR